jgi:hypothetical protein
LIKFLDEASAGMPKLRFVIPQLKLLMPLPKKTFRQASLSHVFPIKAALAIRNRGL